MHSFQVSAPAWLTIARAEVRLGLPEPERRTGRVEADRHPPNVEHVKRLEHQAAALLHHRACGRVGVVGGEVGRPDTGHVASCGPGPIRRPAAVEHAHPVAACLGRTLLAVPPEQLAVEGQPPCAASATIRSTQHGVPVFQGLSRVVIGILQRSGQAASANHPDPPRQCGSGTDAGWRSSGSGAQRGGRPPGTRSCPRAPRRRRTAGPTGRPGRRRRSRSREQRRLSSALVSRSPCGDASEQSGEQRREARRARLGRRPA